MSEDAVSVASVVHDINVRIADLKRSFAGNYLEIGALLLLVKREKLYLETGMSTFAAYATDQGFGRAWAYACVQIADRFGAKALGIAPDRLRMLLPLKLTPEEEEEWLVKARELNAGAFYDEIANRKGKIATDQCAHEKLISVCAACRKVFEGVEGADAGG